MEISDNKSRNFMAKFLTLKSFEEMRENSKFVFHSFASSMLFWPLATALLGICLLQKQIKNESSKKVKALVPFPH